MARYRRSLFKRPINSVKNIVDSTQLSVTGGITTTVSLAAAVNTYGGGVTEVPIGAKVAGVYLFVQIAGDSSVQNMDWYVAKAPNATWTANPVPGSTGGSNFRKFILHEEKGIPAALTTGGNPLTFRGVIKIPRGRQRFAEDDSLRIVLRGASTHSLCIKCIYKFYQ